MVPGEAMQADASPFLEDRQLDLARAKEGRRKTRPEKVSALASYL